MMQTCKNVFLLESYSILRELQWEANYQAQQGKIKSLIMEGFRLLQVTQPNQQSAQLEVIVARLLSYDQGWEDDLAITALFEKALIVAADNAAFQFQLGTWLVDAEIDLPRGIELIGSAARKEENNAIYWAEYGMLLAEQNDFLEGFRH
jgi:hypothetical protein